MRFRNRPLIRSVGFGIVLGVLINLPFILKDYYFFVSHRAVFDRVKMGIPSDQAVDLLQQARIWCGITSRSPSNECYFSDFTYNYLVRIDPKANRVVEKAAVPRGE